MITVKELAEHLETLPQGAQVYLSADAEGNGYSQLASVEGSVYTFKDEVVYGHTESLADEIDLTEEDIADGAVEPIVVLWPV